MRNFSTIIILQLAVDNEEINYEVYLKITIGAISIYVIQPELA